MGTWSRLSGKIVCHVFWIDAACWWQNPCRSCTNLEPIHMGTWSRLNGKIVMSSGLMLHHASCMTWMHTCVLVYGGWGAYKKYISYWFLLVSWFAIFCYVEIKPWDLHRKDAHKKNPAWRISPIQTCNAAISDLNNTGDIEKPGSVLCNGAPIEDLPRSDILYDFGCSAPLHWEGENFLCSLGVPGLQDGIYWVYISSLKIRLFFRAILVLRVTQPLKIF